MHLSLLTDDDREILADAIISTLLEQDRRDRIRAKQARQMARLVASGGNSRIIHSGLQSKVSTFTPKVKASEDVIQKFRAFKKRAEHREKLGFCTATMY